MHASYIPMNNGASCYRGAVVHGAARDSLHDTAHDTPHDTLHVDDTAELWCPTPHSTHLDSTQCGHGVYTAWPTRAPPPGVP